MSRPENSTDGGRRKSRSSRRKSRSGQKAARPLQPPYRVCDAEVEFWRRRLAGARWAIFGNGTVVHLSEPATADETANRAIAILSGLADAMPEAVAAADQSRRAHDVDWLVTVRHLRGASVYAYVGAEHAQTGAAASRLVADRLRDDQDCLRIVSVSSA